MLKAKVVVVTDSTCNLPDELVQKHNIAVIPQILNWDGQSLLDGLDITPDEFYSRLAESKTIPTTSQPSAGEFFDFFSKVAQTAESIVAVLISDELSGTLDSARAAASMMEDFPIEIVDSRSTSMGLGLIVLAAARAAEEGKSAAEVTELARSLVPKLRVIFVVDTLEYLHKGGRIGGAQRLIGSMLSLKPLLHLDDGRIEPLARIRTKKKALGELMNMVLQATAGKEGVHAAVLSAQATEVRKRLVKTLAEEVKPVELIYSELTPVIGTHAGPGTVGIAYYLS